MNDFYRAVTGILMAFCRCYLPVQPSDTLCTQLCTKRTHSFFWECATPSGDFFVSGVFRVFHVINKQVFLFHRANAVNNILGNNQRGSTLSAIFVHTYFATGRNVISFRSIKRDVPLPSRNNFCDPSGVCSISYGISILLFASNMAVCTKFCPSL